MAISWRSSTEVFTQIMRRHGVEPNDVNDVEAAWAAFQDFLQIEIDGIENAETDGDGFIVEWGRWDWNDSLPALSFGRQMAVNGSGDRSDPYWQPEYWRLDLQLCFAEEPAWADLETVAFHDTGFDYGAIGPARLSALAGMRSLVDSYPQLQAMWLATPVRSVMSLERAD